MELFRNLDGELITELARKWYFEGNKKYEQSEKLLLMCMNEMEISNEELKRSARHIMTGRLKLSGSRKDHGLYIDEDDFDIFLYIDKLQENLKKEKEMRIKCQENLSRMYYDIDNDILKYDPIHESKLLSDSFHKAKRFNNNYGWLHPSGEFIPVEWSKHQAWALEYINESEELLNEFIESEFYKSQAAGDFLIEIKGWVLLHNPARGVASPRYCLTKKLNKNQKEFLHDYYIKRGEDDLAIMYKY